MTEDPCVGCYKNGHAGKAWKLWICYGSVMVLTWQDPFEWWKICRLIDLPGAIESKLRRLTRRSSLCTSPSHDLRTSQRIFDSIYYALVKMGLRRWIKLKKLSSLLIHNRLRNWQWHDVLTTNNYTTYTIGWAGGTF